MDALDITEWDEGTKDAMLRLVEEPVGTVKDEDGVVQIATNTGRVVANAIRRERGLPDYPFDYAMTDAEVALLQAMNERGWDWVSRDSVAEVCGVPPEMSRYLMESLDGRGLIDMDARRRETIQDGGVTKENM